MSEIGLFPLPLVLLPSEQVPLHIFEERYKELITECLEESEDFGLVYADASGIREIGTRAAVIEVLERFEDGRLNVVVEGKERFRLLELGSERSFQTGEIVELEDEEDEADPDTVERALGLFDQLRALTGSEVEIPEPDTFQLSFALAGRVELAPDLKLELLGALSERVRMTRVCELLESAAKSVALQRRAAERAATNGRVHLG